MIEFFDSIVLFIQGLGIWGVIISSLIIFVESIFPIIPLLVFITMNFVLLGNVLGFITSYIFTILGCIMSYMIFKNGLGNKFEKLTSDKELITKYTKIFKNISTSKLILIVAFPFTPAFVVNIVAGLTKMDFKKYLTALLFGKISLVLYSAYIGKTFLESFKDPIVLLKMVAMIAGVYLLYMLFKRVFKID